MSPISYLFAHLPVTLSGAGSLGPVQPYRPAHAPDLIVTAPCPVIARGAQL